MGGYSVISTIPPHAPFIDKVARHPVVSGLRLNTVMPVKGSLEDTLKRLKEAAGKKKVWIDLKGRQMRTVGFATTPFTKLEISHPIKTKLPVTVYFCDGKESAELVEIDNQDKEGYGNKLIFLDGPRRVVGPGESLNILDESLRIKGTLTDTDKQYIEAAQKVGMHDYMLSFVENAKDQAELKRYDPEARIVSKIESMTGLKYVQEDYAGERLMAARGDMYVEVDRPHLILNALERIIEKDKNAIAASRIFPSLSLGTEPSCQDIMDVGCMMKMGYKTFMLGDEVCIKKESHMSALNLMDAVIRDYCW